MYTVHNYQFKLQLKEDVRQGKVIRVYQPGMFGGNEPRDGQIALEGPHAPQPHRWYAEAVIKNGVVVSIK